MATVNLPLTSRADTDANLFSDVVGNDQAITTQVNGNLDNDNIAASAAIAFTKLAGIPYYSDTQGAAVSATGDLTDISISPAAGTYFGFATARINPAGTGTGGNIALSVAGVAQITGPTVIGTASTVDRLTAVAQGIITVTAAQVVTVLFTEQTADCTCDQGRLTLIRLA